jgi:AraC family transcriptional regulator, regulatory protein of adaptative response / DNA-3-methyladenine glycosylase II
MDQDRHRLYKALTSRDARFDGLFFVGVTSTDIYCRPICPAKTPKAANCRFFETPHAAEHAGFRPCLRCRPELAPGSAPVDDAQRIAHLIVQRLEEGRLDEKAGLEDIADQFELSSRQVRRIIRKELGVPPIQLLLTRRLLLAKQILTETALPVTDVAFASGFSSLRRFNDAFSARYGMPPTRLRAKARDGAAVLTDRKTSTLQLTYRPPYDWTGILAFLRDRALAGVEEVTGEAYARTVQLGHAKGWIKVTHAAKAHALQVEFTHTLFSGFEMGLRAILGQQVTVRSATVIACRLVEALGDPITTSSTGLRRLTPSPARIAAASVDDIARHGVIAARAKTLIALATAEDSGALSLDGGTHRHPDDAIAQLTALPGIGPWTAHYIAMRALHWPDAFPREDVAIRNNLGGLTAIQAEDVSQAWRPWRSYAVMHVWQMNRVC